jgi:hypothetical protein
MMFSLDEGVELEAMDEVEDELEEVDELIDEEIMEVEEVDEFEEIDEMIEDDDVDVLDETMDVGIELMVEEGITSPPAHATSNIVSVDNNGMCFMLLYLQCTRLIKLCFIRVCKCIE